MINATPPTRPHSKQRFTRTLNVLSRSAPPPHRNHHRHATDTNLLLSLRCTTRYIIHVPATAPYIFRKPLPGFVFFPPHPHSHSRKRKRKLKRMDAPSSSYNAVVASIQVILIINLPPSSLPPVDFPPISLQSASRTGQFGCWAFDKERLGETKRCFCCGSSC
jgi:hypothetical protein